MFVTVDILVTNKKKQEQKTIQIQQMPALVGKKEIQTTKFM